MLVLNSSNNTITGKKDCQDIQLQIDEVEVITGTGEILTDVSASGKKRDWDSKKKMNLELVEILRELQFYHPELISGSRIHQVSTCADYLKFGITKEGRKKLVDANFCRFKFCPICVFRKSLKMFAQISKMTEKLNELSPSSRYIFNTFTIKNVPAQELEFTINQLNEGFKRLVKKNEKIVETQVLQESLLGYLKCLEITYNKKTKTYHPHLHIVFHLKASYFGRNYIKHRDWVQLWKSMLNIDYDPLVNVQAIKKTESGTNPKIIAEVSKYPIKTSDLLDIKNKKEQVEVLATLLENTHHRRFVTFGGSFRAVRRQLILDDIENGSLINIETESEKLNYIAYELYRFHMKFGCYIC